MTQTQLNDLTKRCYEAAKSNGWHEQQRSQNEFILLIQSEMFECFEAYRKKKYAKGHVLNNALASEFLYLKEFDKGFFEMYVKDTFEDELADTAIRIFDCAGAFVLPLTNFIIYFDTKSSFISEHTQFIKRSAFMLDNKIEGIDLVLLLVLVFKIANQMEIDLLRHIELKLEYNKTRGIRHGNKLL